MTSALAIRAYLAANQNARLSLVPLLNGEWSADVSRPGSRGDKDWEHDHCEFIVEVAGGSTPDAALSALDALFVERSAA